MAKQTFAQLKQEVAEFKAKANKELQEAKQEIAYAKSRFKNVNYYQGIALGAIVTAVLFLIGIFVF